jgi:branched-chain amino acid aminotransferase
MTWVWLNGDMIEESALLSPFDRGFTLADGVFETIRATGTRPLWLADHLARLKAGASYYGIRVPLEDHVMAEAIAALLERSDHTESAVRVTLTRGPSHRRGLWPPDDPQAPTLLVTAAALAGTAPQRMTIARTTRRNDHSPLSRMKSLNYGDNLLARREAIGRGYGDALMLNSKGNVVCATAGNLFLRLDRRWVTPPVSDGALPGLARVRLIATIDAREATITEPMLWKSDAGFVSNSLGCTAIAELDGRGMADISEHVDLTSLYALSSPIAG